MVILMNLHFNFFTVPSPKANLTLNTKCSDKKRKRESDSEDLNSLSSPNLSATGSPFILGTPILSETTTDSGIDEYIYINKDQLLQIIDVDRKEVEDPRTRRRFFVATGGELFYNQQRWHDHSLKTSIELSVCGGNIYALLMGDKQPEYFVGQGEIDEDLDDGVEPTYYRVSSKIDFVAEEEDIFNLNKPVQGSIYSLLISFFLGDPDVSNVVGVAEKEDLLIRRLDPEFCFSSYVTEAKHNNYDSVLKEINFIYGLNTDNHELTEKEPQDLAKKNGIEFFRECFSKKLLKHPGFLKILNSEVRTTELLDALSKITETPLSQYENIIDKDISDNGIRMQLKDTLKKRLEIFSTIHQELREVAQPTHDMPLEGSKLMNKF